MFELWNDKQKADALHRLKDRQARARKEKHIDNASLYAGSPMYYYCRACGLLADVLAEGHIGPPRRFCDECLDMVQHGYSETEHTFPH